MQPLRDFLTLPLQIHCRFDRRRCDRLIRRDAGPRQRWQRQLSVQGSRRDRHQQKPGDPIEGYLAEHIATLGIHDQQASRPGRSINGR